MHGQYQGSCFHNIFEHITICQNILNDQLAQGSIQRARGIWLNDQMAQGSILRGETKWLFFESCKHYIGWSLGSVALDIFLRTFARRHHAENIGPSFLRERLNCPSFQPLPLLLSPSFPRRSVTRLSRGAGPLSVRVSYQTSCSRPACG